jgi:HD-like signal output (HDOD) protein
MKISGEIQTTQLADLFQWIEYQRKTGSLLLAGETANHIVYFSQGQIAGIKTNLEIIGEEETQVRLIFKDALNWENGYFEFLDSPVPSNITAANLRLSVRSFFDQGGKAVAASLEQTNMIGGGAAASIQGTAVQPVVESQSDMRSIIIDRVMSGKFKIPLLPTVATKVMEITQRDNYSLNDLSKVILTDQVIAANVLKQANSAFFGVERPVTTLPMAIQRVGSDTVTKLVFALSLQGIKSENDMFLDKKRKLWEYSSACALFARYIALPVKLDHNLAFLCGLMQDFGKIVLLSVIQEVMAKELKAGQFPDETVEKILDTYHPMAGSMVGEKWGLPSQVIAAMAYHRSLSTKGDALLYAAIANLSDVIVTRLEALPNEEISSMTADDLRVREMAGELMFVSANKHLGLNVEQMSTILTRAPECLKSAQELINI